MREVTIEQARQPLSDAERDEIFRVLTELRTFREEMARRCGVEFFPDSTPMIRAMREGNEDEWTTDTTYRGRDVES
jgi:hypothetical protein